MSETEPESTGSDSTDDQGASEGVQKDETGEKASAEKSFAEKVEQTLQTFLDFVIAYSKTLGMALSLHYLKHYREGRFTKESKLIRPLTFLCCSYILVR